MSGKRSKQYNWLQAREHGSGSKKQRALSPEPRPDDRSDPTKRALKVPTRVEDWDTWLVIARGKLVANDLWVP